MPRKKNTTLRTLVSKSAEAHKVEPLSSEPLSSEPLSSEPLIAEVIAEEPLPLMTAELALWGAGLTLIVFPLIAIAAFSAPIAFSRAIARRFTGPELQAA